MESDLGKLFIGGISWDTNEDRLREYFTNYGEVIEAVIMKDRTTGRARGFGFVVFADPSVAERVVMEKHTIDGRVVEAKKAVPRDDQHVLNRNTNTNTNTTNINSSNAHVSPGPTRTKKIFVGGLASTVTESDFKTYFDQFGNITDVVVMYDHNTQRPRGFGFITYDSEDAVDKVLLTTFHELNNKMVEVKRAVPKELSPAPTMRSPIGSYSSFGLNRVNNFLEGYPQGFSPSSIRGYGMRIDGRSSGSIASGRGRYSPFAPAGYGMGLNIEACLNSNYVGNANFNNNNFSYGRGLNLNNLYNGDSSRFNTTSNNNGNHHHPIGYNGVANSPGSIVNSNPRNLWGLGNLNYNNATSGNSNNSSFVGSGIGNFGGFGNNGMKNVLSSVSSISISPLPSHLRLPPKSPINSIRISASSDVQPLTTSAEEMRKHVEVLKTAAKTRQVPSSEILSAFAEIKKNAPDEIDLSTLGGNESPGRTWMLVFISKGKSSDKGNYFPITAIQRFDASGRRIENGVYFGGLGNLSFEGRLSWKKKILAFVFERVRIKAGPFGPFEINLGQTDPNREPSNKDPFFIWFYVDEEIAVAQGKSGGTAFWCRCARVV